VKNEGDSERARILNRSRRLRDELKQYFTDIASWNQNTRKPDEEPIDPDPFGEMGRLLGALEEHLANDPGYGPIAPLKFERSH